jgi:hypothetical protein
MYFHLCHLPTIPLTTLVCRSFYLNPWRWKMFYEKLIVAQFMYKLTDFKRTTIHTMLNHLNEVYTLNHYWSIPELLFLKRQSSGTRNDTEIGRREGCVLATSTPGKRFWNVVRVCVLLRKNFRNGVPLQKYPWFMLQFNIILLSTHTPF